MSTDIIEQTKINKTVINNWSGGSTLQTWADGEWQILYAKDGSGSAITMSLTSHDAARLAWAVSPLMDEHAKRSREYRDAAYELSYPEARADQLRQIADEVDCGGGCENCSPRKIENGEFCGFIAADDLRKLAGALDVHASLKAAEIPKIDLLWESVNALGGVFDPKDDEQRGFCTAIDKALKEIERLGGKDPLPQRRAQAA